MTIALNATSIHRKLSALARGRQFSGVVVIRQGETNLYARAFGYANQNWKIKNTLDTRFRIASMGKLFTAAAVLQLIEAGKVTLQTPIHEILDLAQTTIPSETTIFHLLSMTSGIADYTNEESETFDEDWTKFCREHPLYLLRDNADYLPFFCSLLPYGPLGEKHRYSNSSFILLGLAIEKLSGESYFNYIRRHIFAPAGMVDSDFIDLDDVSPRVAEGYVPVEDENEKITGFKKNYYATTAGGAGDGGSTGSAEDMLRFSAALRAGKIIHPDSFALMTTPHAIEDEENYQGYLWRYGFGCFLMLDGNERLLRWGHTGEEDGVSCRLWHYPQHDIDVVIMGNQSGCAGKVSRIIQAQILNM